MLAAVHSAMGTIIGFECDGGAVLAADSTLVRGDTVVSRSADHLFAFDGVGAAVVGSPGGVDAFEREFDAELRSYRTEKGEPSLDAVERMAATVAESAGVDVLLAARDAEGVARIREIHRDGSALEDPLGAMGSGAELALGALEPADRDVPVSEGETLAREVLEAVAERDPSTGGDVDVWSLADA